VTWVEPVERRWELLEKILESLIVGHGE